MNSESNIPKERVLVEYSADTNALVEQHMPDESDEIKRETKALIEAIKRRAQVEAQGAGELTRDTYLTAVRQARETIEKSKIFDPVRIEDSVKLMQTDAEKNWDSLLKEVSILGDRLNTAAKAAWDALTAPRPDSKL